MKELNPAKIVAICSLFLLVLYLTTGIDWAVTAAFISFSFLFRLEATWLFMVAFATLALYLVFIFLNLKANYILDLSIASYALFVTGLIFYFRAGQNKNRELKLPFGRSFNLSETNLFKMGGILFFIFLIHPVVGVQLAAILGYLAFLIVFHQYDEGRFAFSIALFFFLLCPFFLIFKKDKIAETSAIFTYYFLVIGVVQGIVNLIKNPQIEDEEEEKNRELKLHNEKFKSFTEKVEMPRKNFNFPFPTQKSYKLIIVSSISLIFSFILIYSFLTLFHNRTFSLSKIFLTAINKVKPTATPPLTSIPIPTPTLTFIEVTARLKLKKNEVKLAVENGTEITGLAASTSAILREDGFMYINIGNAQRQDYKNWEFTLKQKDDLVVEYLKYLLKLTTVDTKQATAGAEFDVQLIIGEKK